MPAETYSTGFPMFLSCSRPGSPRPNVSAIDSESTFTKDRVKLVSLSLSQQSKKAL